MLVVSALVPRPLMASNLTPPVLFRTVQSHRPTLLLEEAETLGDNEDLRLVLNAGHVRGTAWVPRLVPVGDDYKTQLFRTWCPKVMALIGRLPVTLEDRSILIPLRRKGRGETVTRLRLDRLQQYEPLRRRAWRWAQDHLELLREADPDVPSEIHDRAQDNWRPLLAVADALGGIWPAPARRAVLELEARVPESESSGEMLLADLREFFAERRADRAFSTDIIGALTGLEDRPWHEWKKGKPLTQFQLARLLKPFNVESKTIRSGDRRLKGYYLDDLEEAFSRYLPAPSRDGVTSRDCAGADEEPQVVTNAPESQPDRVDSRSPDGGLSLGHDLEGEEPVEGSTTLGPTGIEIPSCGVGDPTMGAAGSE
jgi:putative DNA primase/helicase